MTIKMNGFGFIAAMVGVASSAWVLAGMGLPHEHEHHGAGVYSQDHDDHDHERHDHEGHDHAHDEHEDHDHHHESGHDGDHDHHNDNAHDASIGKEAAMPQEKSAADPEEQKTFMTPGGLYTQADIEANGELLPMDKFRNIVSEHDMNPKKGDLLCPITMTKANKKFSWQIGGKIYYFCCPPCISEFVKRAKEKPEGFPSPETLVKK